MHLFLLALKKKKKTWLIDTRNVAKTHRGTREYDVDSIHTLLILINNVDKLRNMVHHFSFKWCIKHLTYRGAWQMGPYHLIPFSFLTLSLILNASTYSLSSSHSNRIVNVSINNLFNKDIKEKNN